MFFCEPCRVENKWLKSFHGSHGRCEICGNTGRCYDVPSKLLPIPEPQKPTKDVHTAHCCQLHGCKYILTKENCTVLLHGGQEFMCSYCYEDIYEEGGWEDAILLNQMYDLGRRAAWKQVTKLAGDWVIAKS